MKKFFALIGSFEAAGWSRLDKGGEQKFNL
jgi:hypothetical protein